MTPAPTVHPASFVEDLHAMARECARQRARADEAYRTNDELRFAMGRQAAATLAGTPAPRVTDQPFTAPAPTTNRVAPAPSAAPRATSASILPQIGASVSADDTAGYFAVLRGLDPTADSTTRADGLWTGWAHYNGQAYWKMATNERALYVRLLLAIVADNPDLIPEDARVAGRPSKAHATRAKAETAPKAHTPSKATGVAGRAARMAAFFAEA